MHYYKGDPPKKIEVEKDDSDIIVYKTKDGKELIPCTFIVVQLHSGVVDPIVFFKNLGLEVVHSFGFSELYEIKTNRDVCELSAELVENHSEVLFAEPVWLETIMGRN